MITNVSIENFRCLRSVRCKLGRFNVLVGPNDSGKSTFLDAIHCLGRGIADTDSWMNEVALQTVVKASLFGVEAVQLRKGGFSPGSDHALHFVTSTQLFRFPTTGFDLIGGGTPDGPNPPDIGRAGEGLAAFMDYINRRDQVRFRRIVEAVRSNAPGVKNLIITTPNPETRAVVIVTEGDLEVTPQNVSVGVRMIIFFTALMFHPSPPALILLEEPESCVHPRRLHEIMGMLRSLANGAHTDTKAQVILTTHSPQLLDEVDLETDQVLVSSRNKDGSCAIQPADPDRLKTLTNDFLLGEIWYADGDKGLVRSPDGDCAA